MPQWKKLSPSIHIITAIISFAGATAAYAAYMGVKSPNDRFVSIEKRQDEMDQRQDRLYSDITTIKLSNAHIEQSVDDLKAWLKSQQKRNDRYDNQ